MEFPFSSVPNFTCRNEINGLSLSVLNGHQEKQAEDTEEKVEASSDWEDDGGKMDRIRPMKGKCGMQSMAMVR